MAGRELTNAEKSDLVQKVCDITARNVFKAEDYVQILAICERACQRRVAEIDEQLKPSGPVQ